MKKWFLPNVLGFNWLGFYSTKTFGENRWAIHYYAPIQGHDLLTRRDLIPSEPDHPRAGNWYYALQLGPLEHKLPPIVANRWRRVTFIVTTGDRFMEALEINDLFEQESPVGQLYVRLKELGIAVEREWWADEEGTAYIVDLALPSGMAGCRSPLGIVMARQVGYVLRPRMNRMFVCGRSRPGCRPRDPNCLEKSRNPAASGRSSTIRTRSRYRVFLLNQNYGYKFRPKLQEA